MIRKINKNTVICFSLIFILVFSFLGLCFFDKNLYRVSAVHSISDSWVSSSSIDISTYQSYLNSLKQNSSFSSLDDGYVCFSGTSSELTVFIIVPSTDHYFSPNAFHGGLYVYYGDSTRVTINSSALSTYNFSLSSYSSLSPTSLNFNLGYNVSEDRYYCSLSYYKSDTNENVESTFYNISCLLSFSNAFQAEYEEVILPFFSLDIDDFYDWIINNNKLSVLPSYIVQAKLKSFLEFYKQFGSSNTFFVSKIGDWFSHMNIASQSLSNISALKSSIDRLYQEYINYRSGTHAYWPGATKIQERNNIDTHTDNNNLNLITDDSSDTLDISILRDILRGVIAISNNLIEGVSKIVTALNQLDFTVNVANNGGANLTSVDIWGSGDITESQNYQALSAAFMDKGVDVFSVESMDINYLDGATQQDSFTVSVVMPDQFVNGVFTEKTITHTIDNTSKMYNTLLLFRKLIAFAVIAYFAIRIRFELPHLIRGE